MWITWINRHFMPLLTHYLSEELSYDARIYIDAQIEEATDWPESLAKALSQSKTVVPLLSKSYFRSAWCATEIAQIRWREQTYLPKKTDPGRLIIPVIIHDGTSCLPKDISKIQYLELQKYTLYN